MTEAEGSTFNPEKPSLSPERAEHTLRWLAGIAGSLRWTIDLGGEELTGRDMKEVQKLPVDIRTFGDAHTDNERVQRAAEKAWRELDKLHRAMQKAGVDPKTGDYR